jgi:hypothetical protein
MISTGSRCRLQPASAPGQGLGSQVIGKANQAECNASNKVFKLQTCHDSGPCQGFNELQSELNVTFPESLYDDCICANSMQSFRLEDDEWE